MILHTNSSAAAALLRTCSPKTLSQRLFISCQCVLRPAIDRQPGRLKHQLERVAALDLPQHVAIILDGNARWAERSGLAVLQGHKRGAQALRVIVQTALDLRIPCLTVRSPVKRLVR